MRELKSKRAGGCDGWPTNLDVTLSVCDKAERNERGECLGLTAIVLKRAPNVSACVCLLGWLSGGLWWW